MNKLNRLTQCSGIFTNLLITPIHIDDCHLVNKSLMWLFISNNFSINSYNILASGYQNAGLNISGLISVQKLNFKLQSSRASANGIVHFSLFFLYTCTKPSSSLSHPMVPFEKLVNRSWRCRRSWSLQFWTVLAPPHGRIWALLPQRKVPSEWQIDYFAFGEDVNMSPNFQSISQGLNLLSVSSRHPGLLRSITHPSRVK